MNLLSSFVGIATPSNGNHWDQKAKNIMVSRPAIVGRYNKFMAGFDLLQRLFALFKYSFRS